MREPVQLITHLVKSHRPEPAQRRFDEAPWFGVTSL